MIDASIKNSFRDKRKKYQISLHLTFKELIKDRFTEVYIYKTVLLCP